MNNVYLQKGRVCLVVLLSMDVKPRKGEKMIKLMLYFWTDGLARTGYIKRKVCWDYGVVSLQSNSSHGITASQEHFSKPSRILPSIEKLFGEQGIKIIHGERAGESGELYASL